VIHKYAATIITALAVGSVSLSAPSVAVASSSHVPTNGACAQLQQEVDDWIAGKVFYFTDPRPDWLKKANENGCIIHGLESTPEYR
jgi:hypothetical protein